MPGPVRVMCGSGRPLGPRAGCSGGELGEPGSAVPPSTSRKTGVFCAVATVKSRE